MGEVTPTPAAKDAIATAITGAQVVDPTTTAEDVEARKRAIAGMSLVDYGDHLAQDDEAYARTVWADATTWCADCQCWHHRLYHISGEPGCRHG